MGEGIFCLNCRWLLSLPEGEGAKRELCMFPEKEPRYMVIEGEGYQLYADPATKNAHHDCHDVEYRFSQEPPEAKGEYDLLPWTLRLTGIALAVITILLMLGLAGCTATDVRNAVPFVPRPTTTQEMAVSEGPPLAYERSVRTILTMGGSILNGQPDTYRIFALMEGAVTLSVVITPTDTGSLLSASQKVAGDRIAYLPVRMCEQFFAAYKR